MLTIFIIKKSVFTLWDIIIDWNLFHWKSKHFILRDELTFTPFYYYLAIILNILFRGSWLLALVDKNSEIYSLLINVLDIVRRVLWIIFRFESEFTSNIEKYRKTRYIPTLPMIN